MRAGREEAKMGISERLELHVAILTRIGQRRAAAGDVAIGSSIERQIVEFHLRELEEECVPALRSAERHDSV